MNIHAIGHSKYVEGFSQVLPRHVLVQSAWAVPLPDGLTLREAMMLGWH